MTRFLVVVKKLWLIWKCCRRHLIGILTLGRWKHRTNGLWIHAPSIWIKCQMTEIWKKIERRSYTTVSCVQILLSKRNLRLKIWKSIGALLWLCLQDCETALATLILFATTHLWLWEPGFSTLLSKTKSRNRLNAHCTSRHTYYHEQHSSTFWKT